MKGKFITIEGTDGSGKSTQIELLNRFLVERGFDVVLSREPGGTEIGEKIRKIILDVNNYKMCDMAEALLYAAARAQHVFEVIRPAIESGRIVICDRFVDSSIAYQGAARGIGADIVKEVNDFAIMGVLPDLTLYFDVEPSIGISRKKSHKELDRLEKEKLSFHKKVYDAYDDLLLRYPERMKRIDANRGIDEVFFSVKAEVLKVLE